MGSASSDGWSFAESGDVVAEWAEAAIARDVAHFKAG